MKKIGFIDYYLDEWHANNYPAWISASEIDGFEISYAWAAMDKPGGLGTKAWCERFSVKPMPSVEALVAASDCLVVLSPDHPEQHETLARVALQSGKPTYIDKTFAPDLAAAVRLFAQAEAGHTPLYSTSALRYAQELKWLEEQKLGQADVTYMATRGPGQFSSYVIHQLEMIVRMMGPGARRAMAVGTAEVPVILYTYDDGRSSQISQLPWTGFSFVIQASGQQGTARDIKADFWQPFIDDLLRFFTDGKPPVPARETCATIAMRDAGLQAMAEPGKWIAVPGHV
ncbi:MAG: hypothetical protein GX173_04475 [Ruminococcaceae bacterium]|nr:hypothetical protein [Oscillospiraceae bacterium]